MAITVRPADLADLPAILDLYAYLAEEAAAFYHEERLPPAEAERMFQEIAAHPGQFLLVADDAGRAVGTVLLVLYPNLTHEGRPAAVLENMVIHPDYRRRGVGAALLRAVDGLARTYRVVKISLTSNAARRGAHRFYEALGWQRSHVGYTLAYPEP
ncbi:MAG: GNAT family N-acetyltransferase [Chloroflexi bacterium]|nr:GNAT family N-acetyltransferase [Chloroflexota bacterium]